MQDSIDMVYHYVKVIREADVRLSWTPHLIEENPIWTSEQVRRFHDHYRRRRDTSSFRLRHPLPNVEDASIPRGLAHADPEVRRILLQELARRRAEVSTAYRAITPTAHDESRTSVRAVAAEVGP